MRRPKVFVGRALPGQGLRRLAELAEVDVWPERRPPSAAALAERTADADGLLSMLTDHVGAELLDVCPRLRVVANYAVGFDNFDLDALTKRGIPAGNTPGVLTDATADLTMALLLALARRIFEARDAVRAGEWEVWDPSWLLGLELAQATLGLVGYGRIGEAVGRRAQAFGMKVLATSRSARQLAGIEWLALDELLERSDVVSVHVGLSEQTRHLIGAREFALMRPSALLVNTSRGEVVDQVALARALVDGEIAGAALDVTTPEPIRPDDPLTGLDNCVILPHIGSATMAARTRMADLAVDNLIAGLSGTRLPYCVNPEVYGDSSGTTMAGRPPAVR